MGAFHRKSEAGLVVILIIVIVLFFFGWLVNFSQRECKSNRDCSSESYCGSDFSCHTYPTIQKTVVQYNFFWPAVVIGIAIVAAAIIFRWDRIMPKENVIVERKIEKSREEQEEPAEPYYKSAINAKTP